MLANFCKRNLKRAKNALFYVKYIYILKCKMLFQSVYIIYIYLDSILCFVLVFFSFAALKHVPLPFLYIICIIKYANI